MPAINPAPELFEIAMVLGMSLQVFTLIHVLISLVGTVSGLVVMYGFFANKWLDGWTALFVTATALTSITGFLFPFNGMTPAIKLGGTRRAAPADDERTREKR